MATRTATAGTFTATFISAAELNAMPGGLIGYAVVTSNQTGITAVVDLTNLTLSLTPGTSRILKIEFSIQMVNNTAAGTTEACQIRILKDGVQFHRMDFAASPGAGGSVTCSGFVYDVAPTSASHTYKLQGGRTGTPPATGTYTLQAAADQPATFAIHDSGPFF